MVSTEYLAFILVETMILGQSLCLPKRFVIIAYTINTKKDLVVKKHTRSLLEELNDIASKKVTEAVVESRAAHVIDSAINLINLIKENFEPDEAYELERRLLNSIRGADPAKFTRGIRKLRDSKDTAKHLKIIEGDLKDDD